MSQRRSPEIEKAILLRKIERQRNELAESCHDWLNATAKFDRHWLKIMDMRKYLVVGSSILAVYTLRHPSIIIRWSRRAMGLWGTLRLFRRTFRRS